MEAPQDHPGEVLGRVSPQQPTRSSWAQHQPLAIFRAFYSIFRLMVELSGLFVGDDEI